MNKMLTLILASIMLLITPLAFADSDLSYDVSDEIVFDGLNITGSHLNDDIEMTWAYQNGNGTNFAEYIVDSIVVVSYERLNPTQGSDAALAAVKALVEEQGITADNMAITDTYEEHDDIDLLIYTIYRIEYMTGSNEDSCKNVDIYYEGTDWAYRFHAQIPADFYDSYAKRLETWISYLGISDDIAPAYYDNNIIDQHAHFEMQTATDQVELIDYEEYSDIAYTQSYSYDGGMVVYSFERYMPCGDSSDAMLFLAADIYADKTDAKLNITVDDDLTQRLNYTTYRIEYVTDSAEDAKQNVDIATILADCTLIFHISVAADQYEDYQQITEGWIGTLKIVDAADAQAA